MNGIKITIIDGHTVNNKSEYFFDQRHNYIVLGCDPEVCDIVFPEKYKMSGVGNEHMAFKRSLGRYQLDLNTDHFVTVDGSPPFEDQELTGTATICLGEEILISIEIIDDRQQPHLNGKIIPQPGTQLKKTTNYLKGAIALTITLICLILFLNSNLLNIKASVTVSEESIQQVAENLAILSGELDKIERQAEHIPLDTIAKTSDSVYLVLVRNSKGAEKAAGTAWVIDDRHLVTNAHVAIASEHLKADEELIVRAPTPPYHSYEIKEIRLHPGYKHFIESWKEYLPCQMSGDKLIPMKTVTPADVALLTVDTKAQLNPPLKLASVEELEQLTPGTKVAFTGYPSEALLPGNNHKPVPVTHQDEIIRITDFFQTRWGNGNNRLIQHGLPITGGASGSPMINATGKVVGVISSMNISRSNYGRMPNAADVNFGQRADFIYDLFGTNPDEVVADLEKQWQEGFKQFYPGITTSNKAVSDDVARLFTTEKLTQIQSTREVETIKTSGDGDLHKLAVKIKNPGLHLVLLTPNQTIWKLKAKPPGGVNLSTYSYPINYGNLSYYFIVLAKEAGEVQISFKAKKKKGTDRFLITIDHTAWNSDINELIDSYVVDRLKSLPDFVGPVQLLKKAERLKMTKDKKYYLTGFNVHLEQKGVYCFVSTPQEKGEVNIALIDESGKKISADTEVNGIGLKVHKHSGEDRKIRFVSYAKKPEIVPNMSVYFLASE